MRHLRSVSLGRVLIVALCCDLLVTAHVAGAYFADEGRLGGDPIGGAVLDAKLAEPTGTGVMHDDTGVDTARDTWEDGAHDTGGAETVSNTLTIDGGAADVDAFRTSIVVSFVENDTDAITATDANAAETAETFVLTDFTFGGRDLLADAVADENANGRIDLGDLTIGDTAANLTALAGVAADGSADLHLSISGTADLLVSVGSGDGLDFRIRVGTHAGSLADVDHARNNTIAYA